MKDKKVNLAKYIEKIVIIIFIILAILAISYFSEEKNINKVADYANISEVPEYTNQLYVTINNNMPYFNENEYILEPFEIYSNLDENGRCQVAYANIGREIMPNDYEDRENISDIKPSGWIQKKFNGEYLYNRCHLIAYQLAGENANEKNLITGTRYFNVSGMLPFENKVATYIEENENTHVLYRVTPIFKDGNLLASGVEIEAFSIEDKGKGICFNVFIYNVQPGITLDYATGESYIN